MNRLVLFWVILKNEQISTILTHSSKTEQISTILTHPKKTKQIITILTHPENWTD